MNEIQKMACQAALEKMIRDGYVCICTIDKILKITGGIPDRKDYEVLHVLHCVHFREMPKDLLRGLPVILARVIGSEGLMFDISTDCKTLLLDRAKG